MEQFLNSNGIIENNNDFKFPPIAGFWRRYLAFLIDVLLIGTIGQIIGWSASSFWFTIGPNGRFLGLFVVLTYFSLMYSKISNGQTIGKRLFKMAVRDKNNKPISIQRSLLRASVLAFPALLNGWIILFNSFAIDWLVSVIVYGIGPAVVYTMVFNRSSRQGLHDLICRTYVVDLRGGAIEIFPRNAKKHWIVSISLITLVMVLAPFSTPLTSLFVSKVGANKILDIQHILQADDRFFAVGVTHNTSLNGRSVLVDVWCKDVPFVEERFRIMNDIAKIALEKLSANQYDTIGILLKTGYDLGIASRWSFYYEDHEVEVWKKKVLID